MTIAEQVCRDIEARAALGLAKYGVPVTGDDSDDWLQHLYEELLDGCQYVKAELERRRKAREATP